jgi:hypothetical protein
MSVARARPKRRVELGVEIREKKIPVKFSAVIPPAGNRILGSVTQGACPVLVQMSSSRH